MLFLITMLLSTKTKMPRTLFFKCFSRNVGAFCDVTQIHLSVYGVPHGSLSFSFSFSSERACVNSVGFPWVMLLTKNSFDEFFHVA